MVEILAFSGSTRSGSYNKKILALAVQGAKDAGANVTVIDLLDFKLPLYDGDLEDQEGIPKNCTKLKNIFIRHQGILLALPEYNSSFSAVFKNVIDWVSRPTEENSEPLSCFKNKTAALISASIGHRGGARGLIHARSMLENINVTVLPTQVCIANADTAFDDCGVLKEKKSVLSLEMLGEELVHLIKQTHVITPASETTPIDPATMNHPSKLDQKFICDFENEGGITD